MCLASVVSRDCCHGEASSGFAGSTGGQRGDVPPLRWTLARSDPGSAPTAPLRNARLMRRLAMVAVTGLVAFAQLGPDTSSGAASPPRAVARPASVPASPATPRVRATAVDHARSSLPLPRAATPAPARRPPARASRVSRASRSGGVRGDVWAALARCESGGDPSARSANGLYSGAFQFSDPTWRSLGYGGRAADHPYATQVAAAKRLQARSGWGQWPRCSRRLGLR